MNNPFLYLRGLRNAELTVFNVQEGQKEYYNAMYNQRVQFSSGQQVKRCILESLTSQLGTSIAPVIFNFVLSKDDKLKNGEPWSPCDPSYPDQLLGGWMKAEKRQEKGNKKEVEESEGLTVKRRSPLSISALRPLHPLLASKSVENITFDRSDNPERHKVRVLDENGNQISEEKLDEFREKNNRTFVRRTWVPEQKRTTGLFVFDMCIDKRRLFSISTNADEPEVARAKLKELQEQKGWIETRNQFGSSLVAPKSYRDKIIPALAEAIVDWKITSNQARTFSLQENLVLALSPRADLVAGAIRSKLTGETKDRAEVIVDDSSGASIIVFPPAEAHLKDINIDSNARQQAIDFIKKDLESYDYEAPFVQQEFSY